MNTSTTTTITTQKDVGRDLNIAKSYCEDKTVLFGVRELVSNCIDQAILVSDKSYLNLTTKFICTKEEWSWVFYNQKNQEIAKIKYLLTGKYQDRLYIMNKNVALKTDALVMSSNKDRKTTIGGFGEGLKLAVLILTPDVPSEDDEDDEDEDFFEDYDGSVLIATNSNKWCFKLRHVKERGSEGATSTIKTLRCFTSTKVGAAYRQVDDYEYSKDLIITIDGLNSELIIDLSKELLYLLYPVLRDKPDFYGASSKLQIDYQQLQNKDFIHRSFLIKGLEGYFLKGVLVNSDKINTPLYSSHKTRHSAFYGYNFGSTDSPNTCVSRDRNAFLRSTHPAIISIIRTQCATDTEFVKEFMKIILNPQHRYSAEVQAVVQGSTDSTTISFLKKCFSITFSNDTIAIDQNNSNDWKERLDKIGKPSLSVPSYVFEILKQGINLNQLEKSHAMNCPSVIETEENKYTIVQVRKIFEKLNKRVHFKQFDGEIVTEKDEVFISKNYLDFEQLHGGIDDEHWKRHTKTCKCGIISILVDLKEEYKQLKSVLITFQEKEVKPSTAVSAEVLNESNEIYEQINGSNRKRKRANPSLSPNATPKLIELVASSNLQMNSLRVSDRMIAKGWAGGQKVPFVVHSTSQNQVVLSATAVIANNAELNKMFEMQ